MQVIFFSVHNTSKFDFGVKLYDFFNIHKGSRKKKKVPPLVAGPLRGGEGGKGRATKEKRTFFKLFFLFCCHLRIKIILL